jgi:hypothetical protein
MTDLEQQLTERGFGPDDVTYIVDLMEDRQGTAARSQAAQLVRLIFLRVEKDSVAGCALRRALGFSGGVSLSRAAKDFCVTKQYLEDLQSELEGKLGALAFIMREVRAAAVPSDGGGAKKSEKTNKTGSFCRSTGPFGRSYDHR